MENAFSFFSYGACTNPSVGIDLGQITYIGPDKVIKSGNIDTAGTSTVNPVGSIEGITTNLGIGKLLRFPKKKEERKEEDNKPDKKDDKPDKSDNNPDKVDNAPNKTDNTPGKVDNNPASKVPDNNPASKVPDNNPASKVPDNNPASKVPDNNPASKVPGGSGTLTTTP